MAVLTGTVEAFASASVVQTLSVSAPATVAVERKTINKVNATLKL